MPSLDAREKAAVQKTLGNMASPLYITVAKLYLCAPNETAWRDTGIWGACGVIFDRTPPSSRHIKIFDLINFEVKFSQEIYEQMLYNAPSSQFHTFEAQNCVVGLSFAEVTEAQEFMNKVRSMVPAAGSSTSSSSSGSSSANKKKSGFFSKLFGSRTEHQDIGRPTDVVHRQHIGYDPVKGFESTDIPQEWTSIFKNAGIKKRDLTNPETAKVIYETLQSQLGNTAGLDEAMAAYAGGGGGGGGGVPPPAPPMDSFGGGGGSGSRPPPAPPVAPSVVPPAAPPLPGHRPAPPLPPAIPSNVPQAPVFEETPATGTTTGGAPPPLPPSIASASSSSSSSAAAAAPPKDSLMSAIQGGFQLRKVNAPNANNALPDVGALSSEETTSLTSVLQKAMQQRLAHIEPTDEADEPDDEWD